VVDDLWINTTTSTTTDEFQYGYDADGDVLYRQNTVNTGFGELYTYTGENELATFQRGTLNGGDTGLTGAASASQSFVTNATGDFTSVTTNGTAQTRTANAQNEITAVSGATTPTYDPNGNMTGDQNGNTFVYDAWDRLIAVKNSGGTTLETYAYDGLNRVVTQTVSGVTTDRYYSDQGQVVEEGVAGKYLTRYVWSPVYVNAVVFRDTDTSGTGLTATGTGYQRLWVQQDANWDVTALVSGSGAVVERYVYTPYGVQAVLSATWGTLSGSAYGWVIGFQGERYDALSGLYRADERFESPTLQRWTSNDPDGYGAGDVDLYRAEGDSPTNKVDPTGLADEKATPTQEWIDSLMGYDKFKVDSVYIIGAATPKYNCIGYVFQLNRWEAPRPLPEFDKLAREHGFTRITDDKQKNRKMVK
jgi:RHS repeat-associated protein